MVPSEAGEAFWGLIWVWSGAGPEARERANNLARAEAARFGFDFWYVAEPMAMIQDRPWVGES